MLMLKRALIVVTVLIIAIAAWVRLGPLPPSLLEPAARQSTIVLDRNGQHLYESLSAEGGRSQWLTADALPQNVVEATLAAEDRRFYRHPGIDPLSLGRATLANLRAGGLVQGGSTITQQVAKLLLDRPRTVKGKLYELIIAQRLEHRFSKNEILALYLNLAPYGNQYAGITRASRGYFGVTPSQLTVAQAAYLAGLPQRPSKFNPRRGSAGLRKQQIVLARMESAGFLTAAERQQASTERLKFVEDERVILAPHFVERVLALHGDTPPAVIRTTLDADLQRQVRGILKAHEPSLAKHGARNVAVAVLDNATGGWLAWEGSGDYFSEERGGAIDGVISPRQPGSALKPFTYALAFERGFTPATALPDIPSHFPTAETGILYSPRNYDGVYRGPMRARVALAGSENVPAVWLLSKLQVPDLLRFFRRFRFTTFSKTADYYGLGLTLGDAEVRLDELVAAYATFARGGVWMAPTMLAGKTTERDTIVSPRTAFWITDILSDRRAREYAFGEWSSLDFPFPVAAKTGTSQAYRDNWAVGYTREVTVGVWVGNFDRKELRSSSGVTGAAPIFNAVMLAAQRRSLGGELPHHDTPPIVSTPSDLEEHSICALSGLRPGIWCTAIEMEWEPVGATRQDCSWHRPDEVIWPAEYRAWALQRGLVRRASSDQPRSERSEPSARASLAIINPPDGATYLIDPTLRTSHQTLSFRAVSESSVTWSVNGTRVGATNPDRPLSWQLRPGKHEIVATDAEKRRDRATIYVK